MTSAYAIILAGGAGTRFWPASRAASPKQLQALAGDPDETLLAATVRRLRPLVPPERVYIATSKALAKATAKVVPKVPRKNILQEPAARNTAPCIAWATRAILREDPDALVAVLPSDHFIRNAPAFLRTVERALLVAEQDYLVTIGIVPTRAETGYGYISVGARISHGASVVSRFVEKPDRARAEAFLRGGHHLWNAGMFFFRGRTMARAVEKHLPGIARGLDAIDRAAARGKEPEALARVFPRFPSVSIDYGVMEKADHVAVVRGRFGWNDVGSWASAWELAGKDKGGNAVPGDTVLVEAKGNLVYDLTTRREKRTYALVGLDNLVLVETDDAVLVMKRERAQDVRQVVATLKSRGDGRLL